MKISSENSDDPPSTSATLTMPQSLYYLFWGLHPPPIPQLGHPSNCHHFLLFFLPLNSLLINFLIWWFSYGRCCKQLVLYYWFWFSYLFSFRWRLNRFVFTLIIIFQLVSRVNHLTITFKLLWRVDRLTINFLLLSKVEHLTFMFVYWSRVDNLLIIV